MHDIIMQSRTCKMLCPKCFDKFFVFCHYMTNALLEYIPYLVHTLCTIFNDLVSVASMSALKLKISNIY